MSRSTLELTVLDDATIESLLNYPDVIELMDATFAADGLGQARVLPVVGHSLNGGRFSVKSSHLRLGSESDGMEVFGLKMGSYFPNNRQRNVATHNAVMLLGDPMTGQPTALLAANAITEYRTAAAGALAARYLSRPDASVVALFGSGAQARAQLEALRCVRSIKEVRVWSRVFEHAQRFVDASPWPDVTVRAVREGREACAGADIIITVTPAQAYLVEDAWVAPGTHVNAMGSDAPGKQELDPALVARAKVVVDRRTQSLTLGELQEPVARELMRVEDVHAELGEVCAGLKSGREAREEVTVFDSTGVSIQDTALAGHVLRLVRSRSVANAVTL